MLYARVPSCAIFQPVPALARQVSLAISTISLYFQSTATPSRIPAHSSFASATHHIPLHSPNAPHGCTALMRAALSGSSPANHAASEEMMWHNIRHEQGKCVYGRDRCANCRKMVSGAARHLCIRIAHFTFHMVVYGPCNHGRVIKRAGAARRLLVMDIQEPFRVLPS